MICKQYYITRGTSTRSLLFERALARQLAMPFIIQMSVVYELSVYCASCIAWLEQASSSRTPRGPDGLALQDKEEHLYLKISWNT
jgi:hypothetical protein